MQVNVHYLFVTLQKELVSAVEICPKKDLVGQYPGDRVQLGFSSIGLEKIA
jgi:hypothetical protein